MLAHAHQQRPRAVVDDIGIDHTFADILQRGNLVHHVEQHFLDRRAQSTRASLALFGLTREVEVVKKQLLKTERRDDSTVL